MRIKLTPRIAGAVVLALGSMFAGYSCGAEQGSDWGGTVDTLANGALAVRNPNVGLWSDETAWVVVDSLRIGALDDEHASFSRISDIAVDLDGRIYVHELGSTFVKVFDPQGRYVRTIGERGGGPGEILSGAGIAVDDEGRLWLADAGNVRYSLYDREGGFLSSSRWTDARYPIPRPLSFDAAGNLICWAAERVSRTDVVDVVVQLDSAFQIAQAYALAEFKPELFEFRDSNNRLRMVDAVPFSPRQHWAVDAVGDLWVGISDQYRIVRQSPRGDTLLVLSRDADPSPVTDADRDAALSEFSWFTDGGGKIDETRIPSTKPHFQSIHLDDRSHVWVRRFVDPGAAYSHFDVFDPEGRYLGEIRIPYVFEGRPKPLMKNGHVYGVVLDELNVPYVVRVAFGALRNAEG